MIGWNDVEDAHYQVEVGMDNDGFHSRHPLIFGKSESIWVIVDRLKKSTHFVHVKVNYNIEKLARYSLERSFNYMGSLFNYL